jgi:hypothetical protein
MPVLFLTPTELADGLRLEELPPSKSHDRVLLDVSPGGNGSPAGQARPDHLARVESTHGLPKLQRRARKNWRLGEQSFDRSRVNERLISGSHQDCVGGRKGNVKMPDLYFPFTMVAQLLTAS